MKIIDKDKTVKSNSDVYEIYLGTFIDNAFTWYSIKKFKDLTQAYKEYKKYVNTQLKYTDEELQQVWDTGRLDIELRQGNKLLNWVGIYSREVKDLTKEEEKEAEKGEIKKKKKDSVDFNTELAKLNKMIGSAEESEIISQCEKVLDLVSTKDELESFRKAFAKIDELDRQTAREFYYMIQAKEKQLARMPKKDSVDPKLLKQVQAKLDKFRKSDEGVIIEDPKINENYIGLYCSLKANGYGQAIPEYDDDVASEYYEIKSINMAALEDFLNNTLELKVLGKVKVKYVEIQDYNIVAHIIDNEYAYPVGDYFLHVEITIDPKQTASDKYFITFRYEDSFKWTAGETEFIETLGFKDEDLEFDHVPTQDEIDTRFSEFLDEMFKRDTRDLDIEDGTEITGTFSKIKLYSESDDEMKEIKEYKPINFNYIITK